MAELSTDVPIVLVIDADAATSRLAALYLEAFPFEVRRYATLEAVFPLQDAGRTLLVLLNVSLPASTGAPLLKNLHSELPGVPFFGLEDPGFSNADSESDSSQSEVNLEGILKKPLDADAFFKALDYSERIEKETVMTSESNPASPANPLAPHLLQGMIDFLEEMGMGDDLAIKLAQSFLERGPEYVEEIRAKHSQEDYDGMDAPAHAMKGMSGNLRFHALTELSDQIRTMSKSTERSGLQELVNQLRDEYTKVEIALREHWTELA